MPSDWNIEPKTNEEVRAKGKAWNRFRVWLDYTIAHAGTNAVENSVEVLLAVREKADQLDKEAK